MAKYKTKPGRILPVQRRRVTDDPDGVELRDTKEVQDHVRNGRLLLVENPPKAPRRAGKEE